MAFTHLDLFFILSYLYILNIIFSHFLEVKFETGLPTTISFIVFFLYLFGISSYLVIGYYLLLILPFALLLIGIIFLKYRPIQLSKIFTPGMAIYTLWLLFVFYFYRYQELILHDDLNFWGLTIKNSMAINSIGNGPGTNTGFHDYPPAAALFAYFLQKLHGGYSESISLFSMSVWGYSILALFAEKIDWKNFKLIILFSISGYLIPSFFINTDFHTYLTVDYLLSMLFGYSLYLSTRIEKSYSSIEILQLSFAITSIILLKKIGIFLSLIILIISIINIIYIPNNSILKSIKNRKFSILILITSFLFPILSWKYYLNFHHLTNLGMHDSFFNLIGKLFTLDIKIPERLTSVWSAYWRALWSQSITEGSINLSFITFIALVLIASAYIIRIQTIKIKLNFFLILIFIGLYLIGHFSMYGFVLSDGESLSLSSFSRYLLPLTVGLFIPILGYLLVGFSSRKIMLANYYLLGLLLLPLLSYKFPASQQLKKENSLSQRILQLEQAIASSNDTLLNQWAKEQLEKIEHNKKPALPSRNFIEDIGVISTLTEQQEMQKKGVQMKQLFALNRQLIGVGKNLCLIEGQEGASYGYAMDFRYTFAPIVTERILTYRSNTPGEYDWHKTKFYSELKSCGGAFVLGVNSTLLQQYQKFFLSDLRNYGYYKVTWDYGEPRLELNDCSICE